ncbi:Exocyst complex component SEC3 [Spathaspora sp. JA1]|nr:Exocyst complex component SEC3 [Spathaspora sp. JA1]
MQSQRASGGRRDDPKRRFTVDKITNECYAKTIKVNGKPFKEYTYQTHIDILEYALYPSTPPDPNKIGSVKKRILVLAIKYPGIAVLQKGKLHEDKKVYQIGRTWDLNELVLIKRQGPEGIIFQLNKTYYWKSDEGEDRLLRFCRYVTQAYGNYMGKYPKLEGFNVQDLRLPPQPAGVAGSTHSSVQSLPPPQQFPPQQQFQHPSQPSQKPKPANDLYKDIDFTANGQLPMKPMKIMQSDRPGNVSHPTNDSLPSITDRNPSRESHASYSLHQKTSMLYDHDNNSFNFGSKESQRTPTDSSPYKQYNTGSARSLDPKQGSVASVEGVTEAGMRLQDQIERQSIGSEKSAVHEQLKAFTEAIPQPPKSPDFGIEEITDESEEEEVQRPISIRKRSLKQQPAGAAATPSQNEGSSIIDESTKLEGSSRLDSSIQELADMLNSHISLNQEEGAEPAKEVPEQPPTFRIEAPEEVNSPQLSTSGLNIVKKSTSTDEKFDVSRIEHDPEVDEMYDDIGWSFKHTTESLIKQISIELTNVKQSTVKELTKIDLGDSTSSNGNNEITRSLDEVEHLNQIFQRMEVDFKMLASEIELIDQNSQGLQVKFINKKLLYNDLKSILDKVSIDPDDLEDISRFKKFNQINMLDPLEGKLLTFYNAIVTIRSDATTTDDLSSMKALKQYQSRYNSVSIKFIENFCNFIKNEFKQVIDGCANLDRFNSSTLFLSLNKLLIYSGITYFIKEVEISKYQELIQYFNGLFSGFFDKLITAKISHMIASVNSSNSATNYDSVRESINSSAFDLTSFSNSTEDIPLKKSRTLRLSRKKVASKFNNLHTNSSSDLVQKKLETPSGSNGNSIEDPKLVNSLIEESQILITFIQYFIGQFFHYEIFQQRLDFVDYIESNKFQTRIKQIQELPNIDEVNTNYYTSNDLISNLSLIFGNYINIFMKKVNPLGLNIPIILLYVEHLIITIESKNQDFLLINFLNKAYDKYVNNWNKFIKSQIELLNNSIIVAKSGILQSIKNVNYLFVIIESSIDNQDIRPNSKVKLMIDNAYMEVSQGLMNLFMREDPLLKNHDSLDDKEREYRNVSIIQNIYFILNSNNSQQFNLLTNSKLKLLFDNLTQEFNKVEDVYFQKQLTKNIGKLVEFINNYEALEKLNTSKYNKKYVKSMLTSYSIKDINIKVQEINRKFEKHFIIGDTSMFEKDLLDKLWQDMENKFQDYFKRLRVILTRDFDKEFDYNITSQDIHQIFKSIR